MIQDFSSLFNPLYLLLSGVKSIIKHPIQDSYTKECPIQVLLYTKHIVHLLLYTELNCIIV